MPEFNDLNPWKITALLAIRNRGLKSAEYFNLISQGVNAEDLLSDPTRHCSIAALTSSLNSPKLISQAITDLQSWTKARIFCVALGEESYPHELLQLHEPPQLLWYRGRDPKEWGSAARISVIGSRKATSEGSIIARDFSQQLVERGACIVSGLAYGIDSMAHRGALDAKSDFPTIAVLGSGLQQVYPRPHEPLVQEIIEKGGVVLSQFEPSTKPFPANFLNRNQIIAVLSQTILIIQAADKSGSLVTARFGLDHGRDVLVIPGAMYDPLYQGSNRLIRDGAHLITDFAEIVELIPGLSKPKTPKPEQLSPDQQTLVSLLADQEKLHMDVLLTKVPEQESLYQDLFLLEDKGIIIQLPGNYLALKPSFRKPLI